MMCDDVKCSDRQEVTQACRPEPMTLGTRQQHGAVGGLISVNVVQRVRWSSCRSAVLQQWKPG